MGGPYSWFYPDSQQCKFWNCYSMPRKLKKDSMILLMIKKISCSILKWTIERTKIKIKTKTLYSWFFYFESTANRLEHINDNIDHQNKQWDSPYSDNSNSCKNTINSCRDRLKLWNTNAFSGKTTHMQPYAFRISDIKCTKQNVSCRTST